MFWLKVAPLGTGLMRPERLPVAQEELQALAFRQPTHSQGVTAAPPRMERALAAQAGVAQEAQEAKAAMAAQGAMEQAGAEKVGAILARARTAGR
jgi:hypothetical protein